MIPHLPQDATYAVHLRAPSVSGGKDWVGCHTGNRIHTFWGKTGQIKQKAIKTGNGQALDKIICQKLAKGYAVIDAFTAGSGWSSERRTGPMAANGSGFPARHFPLHPKPANVSKDLVLDATSALSWDF